MCTRTCSLPRTATRIVGILAFSCCLAGCSTPNFFTKKGKNDNADTSLAQQKQDKAVKQLKNPVRFHLAYAKWQEGVGQLGEARQSYQIVLDQEPNNTAAKLGMARIAFQTGQLSDAERRFQEVLDRSTNKPEVLDEVAQFYAEQKQWDQAVGLLSRAVQLEPENTNYHYHLGVALAHGGDLRRAYDELSFVMGEAETYYNMGYILYKQGKVDDAEQHLARALQIKPDLVQARNLIDEMHLAAGRPVQNNRQPQMQQVSGTVSVPGIQIMPKARNAAQPFPADRVDPALPSDSPFGR